MNRVSAVEMRALAWVAAAFAAATLLHADRVPPWATAAAAACICWRLLAAGGVLRLPSRLVRIVLTVALLATVYSRFRTLNGLSAGTALLVVMGSIKLLETRTVRDRGIVIGAALFLLLAACLDRQSLARAPLYLTHVWLCCTACVLSAHPMAGLSSRAALALAGRSLAIALPLALLLFVFFPRVAGSFWALTPPSQAVTGLDDSMSPGSISELSESQAPVFRVRFHGPTPPPHERYWRGPVLESFDGYTWRDIPGYAYAGQPLEFLGTPYAYRVTMEPHAHRWWFALDFVTTAPARRVQLMPDHLLLGLEPVSRQMTYEAVSHTRTRSTAPLSMLARRYNTQLPEGRNPRSAALARSLRATTASDVQYIAAVTAYFARGGFEYTLTPPRLDYDSVDDFLFNTRQGFCGHYASAFVSLMRSAGLPARIVTGYLGAEWNPVGQFHVIRQSDAHAWAEVWLDGSGWRRVDPTAVVAPERLRRGIFDLIDNAGSGTERLLRGIPRFAALRQNWEALNAWWEESVVRFDFTRQLNLLGRLGIAAPEWKHLAWALSLSLALWLAWVAWHVGRRARPAVADDLARAYARLCRKLARAAVARLPHQGPLAYADALDASRPDVADLARPLLARYAELRFGTGGETATFVRAVRRLRVPSASPPFPPQWRAMLERTVPLYRRLPQQLRLRLEPVTRAFLEQVQFTGCNGLIVTEDMKLTVAVQASLLIVRRGPAAYDELRSVLLYPDEFLVTESQEDDSGVVTEGTRALSGQTFDTARIVLSWRDVQESGGSAEAYNVVLHEFAHYLDHHQGGMLSDAGPSRDDAPAPDAFAQWHAVLKREYDALCAAVDRDEPTLIDPYGAEHPAEFFAVATETFFEQPQALRARHAHLYDELARFYRLDPSGWS